MTDTFIMEELSRHYVEAIANQAGYYTHTGKDFGIDLCIKKAVYDDVLKQFYPLGKGLDIQLKSVSERYAFYYNSQRTSFNYWLETKNYNHLVKRSKENGIIYPLYLIVFVMPNDNGQWLNHNDNELMLRKCAYWFKIPPNLDVVAHSKKSIKIVIPKVNKVSKSFLDSAFGLLD